MLGHRSEFRNDPAVSDRQKPLVGCAVDRVGEHADGAICEDEVIRVPLETRAPPPCFPILRPLPAGAMMRPPDKEAAWISSNGSVVIGAGSLA